MISKKEAHDKWILKNPDYYKERYKKIKKGEWEKRYNVLTKKNRKEHTKNED